MSLIKCPECGKEVSSSALKCPNCGKQLRKAKRGFWGKIFLWLFYGFNIFMLWWMIGGISVSSDTIAATASDAERAGATIGAGLGLFILIIIWVIGDIITGLLALVSRPKN